MMLAGGHADLAALEVLAAMADQDDRVVGFHAQQACEEALEAVEAVLVAVPSELADLAWLTPWAVTRRYEQTDAPLDREEALTAARVALGWADGFLE